MQVKEKIRIARSFLRGEKGQGAIEYALLAVFIAIVLVFLFHNVGIDSGLSGAGSKTASTFQR